MITPKKWKTYFNSKKFQENYIYTGTDLGVTYFAEKTVFKLWAPTAQKVVLRLYSTGSDKEPEARMIASYELEQGKQGVFTGEVEGDYHGVYYDYLVEVDSVSRQTADPYAKACGVNGARSMVVDWDAINPAGWETDSFIGANSQSTVIYELHVKDFSYDPASGICPEYRGKYLAFTQNGTTLNGASGQITGMDYLKSLGITHVHLLPVYDFGSVDESGEEEQFNWGYDPVNYNVPEGSYATCPYDGRVRLWEFKKMVMAFHNAGLGVIMDVVYNHTYDTDSWFQKTVPYYYYRQRADGSFSDGSACGNETASERVMVGNYIKQSVFYWKNEYHIDGFRFDLMGLHHTELLNEIREELDKTPNGKQVLLYGEPWIANASAMGKGFTAAVKDNVDHLHSGIGIFCDDTRDSIKGSVFHGEQPGFVNGGEGFEADIQSAVLAWCDRKKKWKPKSPASIITYVSAHDNYTLWDKLVLTLKEQKDFNSKQQDIIQVNKLVAAILFTSQGTVFFQAGEEFGRTKLGADNTFQSSPKLNQLDWNRTYEFLELVEYYKGLMEIRRQFSPFYNHKMENIRRTAFYPVIDKGVVAFLLWEEVSEEDSWSQVFVAFNASAESHELCLPIGEWKLLADGESSYQFQKNLSYSKKIVIGSKEAVILGS